MNSIAPGLRVAARKSDASDLRVALFSGNYNCVRDGANNALNRLVGHLLDRGAAVRVYSPTVPAPAFAPVGDLVSVPSIPFPGRSEYRFALGLPAAVRRDVRAFRPTLVHLSAPDPLNLRAQRLAREMGVPVIASLHTRFESYLQFYGFGVLRRAILAHLGRFYRGCDRLLAANPTDFEYFDDIGISGERVALWRRGVDTGLFNPGRRSTQWRKRRGYRDDEAVVLFFGRLVREKGTDAFAAAVAELRARGHALKPLVVGAGPDEDRLRARLGDAVFTGHLDGEALARAVASADILLNPSVTEAFGNVNLEAMASGLSIVSADVPSAQALIRHGETGLLVAPLAEVFADAVGYLFGEPRARHVLSEAAVRAAGEWRWPELLDQILESYRRLVPPADRTGVAVASLQSDLRRGDLSDREIKSIGLGASVRGAGA